MHVSSPLQHGITEVKVEETGDGHILHLQAEDTLIQLEEDGTHIVCDNNEPLRTTLRDLVLRFLQKLWPSRPHASSQVPYWTENRSDGLEDHHFNHWTFTVALL